MEVLIKFFKKLKIGIQFELAIPLLGIFMKDLKTTYYILQEAMHAHAYSCKILNSQSLRSVLYVNQNMNE